MRPKASEGILHPGKDQDGEASIEILCSPDLWNMGTDRQVGAGAGVEKLASIGHFLLSYSHGTSTPSADTGPEHWPRSPLGTAEEVQQSASARGAGGGGGGEEGSACRELPD